MTRFSHCWRPSRPRHGAAHGASSGRDHGDDARPVRRLLAASLTGDVATVAGLVTEDVWGYFPNAFVNSRGELLAEVERLAGAFSGVTVDITHVSADRAAAEWLIGVDFTGALVLDEEFHVVVGPTGQRVQVAGATFVDFDGALVRAFRHYFDNFAIFQQVMLGDLEP